MSKTYDLSPSVLRRLGFSSLFNQVIMSLALQTQRSLLLPTAIESKCFNGGMVFYSTPVQKLFFLWIKAVVYEISICSTELRIAYITKVHLLRFVVYITKGSFIKILSWHLINPCSPLIIVSVIAWTFQWLLLCNVSWPLHV